MPIEPSTTITLPGFVFDLQRRELKDARSGQRIALRPQTAALLQRLASDAGEVLEKDELLRAVWPNVVVTEEPVAHIHEQTAPRPPGQLIAVGSQKFRSEQIASPATAGP